MISRVAPTRSPWGSWKAGHLERALVTGGSGEPIRNWLVVWNACIGNNDPNWLSYFSEGLKPPTRQIPHYMMRIIWNMTGIWLGSQLELRIECPKRIFVSYRFNTCMFWRRPLKSVNLILSPLPPADSDSEIAMDRSCVPLFACY